LKGGQFIAHAKRSPFDGHTLATVIPEIETLGANLTLVANRGHNAAPRPQVAPWPPSAPVPALAHAHNTPPRSASSGAPEFSQLLGPNPKTGYRR
jgi:hypothetical protein